MQGSDYAVQDVSNWDCTEKLDGFFARWDGDALLSREGADFNAPKWITDGLPAFPLDCELFAGYGKRQTLNGCHKWKHLERWRAVELVVFDTPVSFGFYKARHAQITKAVTVRPGLRVARRWLCQGGPALVEDLRHVLLRGGEGLILRNSTARYTVGRVNTMLKVLPEFIIQKPV